MGNVFFSVGMSLDGYIAPAGMDLEHADDPTYNDWLAQWSALQNWVFQQRFFRENLQLGEGGVRPARTIASSKKPSTAPA